ncbi:MAG: hypothetical protein CVV27_04355 [Candidatus Melainabacteria bacterium HGW-Melainabacteria-1]|nr:MAG: hypothetical protein CVV27_04355 [Candidatus Melainabacteria bacterium HGW-Melainabacteria-1]
MPELSSHQKIKLGGEMTCAYAGTLYEVDGASLKVLFDEDRTPYEIELRLNFSVPEQVKGLARIFPGIEGLAPPHRFAFGMKDAMLLQHRQAFQEVDDVEQWITVAGGACFELANYDYRGRADAI